MENRMGKASLDCIRFCTFPIGRVDRYPALFLIKYVKMAVHNLSQNTELEA